MRFKKFVGRKIILRNSRKKELEEFEMQVDAYNNVRDAFEINYTCDYITIKDKRYNLIGIIKIARTQESALVSICIPNEVYRRRYGTKVIEQFIEECKKQKKLKIKNLYFLSGNSIIETYRNERPRMFKNDLLYIHID